MRARPRRVASARPTRSAASASLPRPSARSSRAAPGCASWLRSASQGVRLSGPGGVAAQAAYLPERVVALSRQPSMRTDEVGAARAELRLHDLPGALGHQQLQLMDPGHVGVQEGPALRLRPPRQRLGPRPHPREVAELVAEVDHRAIEVAGPHRVDAPRKHREHRLVEVGEALARVPAAHGGHAAGRQREAAQRRFVMFLGQGGDLSRRCVGGIRIAGDVHVGSVVDVEQVAVQHSAGQPRDDPSAAGEPCHPHREVAPRQPLERQSQRAVCRLERLALGDQATVDLLGDRHGLR